MRLKEIIIDITLHTFLEEVHYYYAHDPRPFWINAENFDFWAQDEYKFFTENNMEGGS